MKIVLLGGLLSLSRIVDFILLVSKLALRLSFCIYLIKPCFSFILLYRSAIAFSLFFNFAAISFSVAFLSSYV